MGFIRNALRATAALIEHRIEKWGDPLGETTMLDAMRRARDRAAELAIENARLHDEIETLTKRLNEIRDIIDVHKTTLFSDEVTALKWVVFDKTDATANELDGFVNSLRNLLARSNNCGMTYEELQTRIHNIILGREAE